MTTKEELKEELKSLLDDRRTGLRDSSDTNKTRYAILALFDTAFSSQRSELAEKVRGMRVQFFVESAVAAINGDKRYLPIKDKEDATNIRDLGYNQALSDVLKLLESNTDTKEWPPEHQKRDSTTHLLDLQISGPGKKRSGERPANVSEEYGLPLPISVETDPKVVTK